MTRKEETMPSTPYKAAKATKSRRLAAALLVAALGAPVICSADTATGVVTMIEAIPSPSVAMRFFLANVTTMCSGSTNSFAYLNPGDPNYSAVIAALLTAKVSGATVDISSSVDSVGCCHIYDVVVH